MPEQLDDASSILGVRPAAAEQQEEPAGEQQQEAESNTESEEHGEADADASGDELESEGSETEGDVEQEGESDPVALAAEIVELKKENKKTELMRRDWQSKAMSADADLGKALDGWKAQSQNVGQQTQTTGKGNVLDRLKAMDPTDVVDAGTMTEILGDYQREQAEISKNMQLNGRLQAIETVVSGKSDLKETVDFFQQNGMERDQEAGMLNTLGNYYRGKTAKLEEQSKKAFADGKIAGAKEAGGRKQRLQKIPPVTGTPGVNEAPLDDPMGLFGIMEQRRKVRGIRQNGDFR